MDRKLVAAVKDMSGANDGVILLPQIRELGGSAQDARTLVAGGHLDRVGRNTFHDPGHQMDARAAIRIAAGVAGPGTAVSHGSAAWLLGMIDAPPGVPHVSVEHRTSARGWSSAPMTVHHTRIPLEAVWERGFLVTPACRVLVDLAGRVSVRRMDGLIDRAFAGSVVSVAVLQRELARHAGRPGVRSLAERLTARQPLDLPGQSVLEAAANRLLLDLHREQGLPLPKREHHVLGGRYRLDYAWPAIQLCVEVDGYKWHQGKDQTHDFDRRSLITAEEWVTMPFTWDQVMHDGGTVAQRIAATYRWVERLRRSAG